MKLLPLIALLSCIGCATTPPPSLDETEATAAAIRFAAAKLCGEWPPCDAIFVSLDGRDPSRDLLASLASLNAHPKSQAVFIQEKPNDVWLQPTDRGSRAKGHLFSVKSVEVSEGNHATVDMFYGVCQCRLRVAKSGNEWLVEEEEILGITVF